MESEEREMTADEKDNLASGSVGYVADGFGPVKRSFDAMLYAEPGYSAQVTAVWRGQTVIDLAGGPLLGPRSVTGVFSSSKGVAAAVIGLLIDDGVLRLDEAVSFYWPEFANMGKGSITVRQALAHRAGLIGVEGGFSPEELANSSLAAAKIAASVPLWRPDTAHGYHALTIGVLMEELARRTTGSTLQAIYERRIRGPRGIDFFLGFPEAQESRFATVVPPSSGPAQPDASSSSDSMQSLAFNVLHTSLAPDAGVMGPNRRAMRAAGTAAINGIGSARGLADLYGAVLGSPNTPPLLGRETIRQMSMQHSFGIDRVLGHQTSFGVVYMKPHPLMEFGSFRAFGHDGAGGALGFADPLHELAFGYIPMPMQLPGGADPKAVRLSQEIRRCIQLLHA